MLLDLGVALVVDCCLDVLEFGVQIRQDILELGDLIGQLGHHLLVGVLLLRLRVEALGQGVDLVDNELASRLKVLLGVVGPLLERVRNAQVVVRLGNATVELVKLGLNSI